MFSGIVEQLGEIISVLKRGEAFVVTIKSNYDDFTLGESIAVDGACLTVTTIKGCEITVDISQETLALTNLRDLKPGDYVNLERALRLSDRLSGHMVLGHVDQTGVVQAIASENGFTKLTVAAIPKHCMPYLVHKGSVTMNGVSLTLNHVSADGFSVLLIPHTLEQTNLKYLKVNAHVNLEFDYLAKITVQRIDELLLARNSV